MAKGKKEQRKAKKSHGSARPSMKKEEDEKEVVATEEENEYLQQVLELKEACADWDNLFSKNISNDRRMLQWQYASMKGEALVEKYAWAIPNNTAIKIISKFSPLVEMGAGNGYWAHLIEKRGGYVLPFDIAAPNKDQAWTKVFQGSPSSILSKKVTKNKDAPLESLNLFLCYPDQQMEVGLPSIEAFQEVVDSMGNSNGGGHIIHVGELLVTGCISGAPQAPWGRTSSPNFQEKLYKDYHCVLSLPLESFPFSRDFLTIWKRTEIFSAKGMDFEGDGGNDNDSKDRQENNPCKKLRTRKNDDAHEDPSSIDPDCEDDEDDEWVDIPVTERLPYMVCASAAPCYQKLIEEATS